jgi:N-acetylglucosaminyldiphosphoundecaprenol N-acetyl-beta-D-mannosaminyltransferase
VWQGKDVPRLRESTAPTYTVCSVPIATLDASAAAERIVADAVAGRSCQVHLCNAYTLSLVDQDPQMRAALQDADLNMPDGAPVAWFGRKLGTAGPVRGADLVSRVTELGGTQLRHYLYGGKPGVADEMAQRLTQVNPGFVVAGTETPPFTEITEEHLTGLITRVRESGATVLWIGLGTPRQDYLVHRLSADLSMPIIPVGAAFDFWAGTVKQAPPVLHGTGLEWLYRLATEPRRLWRRYLLGNPRFLASAWRHRS